MNRYVVEMRSSLAGKTLTGHAAVFGQHAEIRGGWEAIAPGAFDAALASQDNVLALRDHNPSMLLGSTRAGTLRLGTDDDGLTFEIDLPDTPIAAEVRELVARGDIAGASFGFLPGTATAGEAPDGRQLRTHTSLKRLIDVSVVPLPAYEGTDVRLRAVAFTTPPLDQRTQLILARHRARLIARRGQ